MVFFPIVQKNCSSSKLCLSLQKLTHLNIFKKFWKNWELISLTKLCNFKINYEDNKKEGKRLNPWKVINKNKKNPVNIAWKPYFPLFRMRWDVVGNPNSDVYKKKTPHNPLLVNSTYISSLGHIIILLAMLTP